MPDARATRRYRASRLDHNVELVARPEAPDTAGTWTRPSRPGPSLGAGASLTDGQSRDFLQQGDELGLHLVLGQVIEARAVAEERSEQGISSRGGG